ncbi:MAG: zinc-dependent metalloprotease [Actinomycetota bacterium]
MEGIDNSELSRRLLEIPLFREINNALRGQSGPVDWKIAGEIGGAVAASGMRSGKPSAADLEEFNQACRIAELAVVGHTGLGPVQGVTDVRLLWRTQWAQVNLDSLKPLIERLASKLSGHAAAGPGLGPAAPLISAISPFLMGSQVGLVIGYMSHKALGVWDLCLPRTPPGRLYFNYPNILDVERDLGIKPQEFRMWLALHEVSHELHFQAVSWIRPYLVGLIEQYMDAAEIDTSQLASRMGNLSDPQELSAFMQRPEDLFPLLRSPAQEGLVEKILCCTSAAEGYSDWIVRKAGLGLTESFDKIAEGMTRRRAERSSPERMMEKMFGLDLGNEQQRRGHRFVTTIAEAGGLEHLWQKPENLPDLGELAQPNRWLSRIGPK